MLTRTQQTLIWISLAILLMAGLSPAANAEAATNAEPPTLNLQWTVPTARVAGDALPIDQLAGYQILYTINGAEQPPVEIDDPELTSTVIPLSLPPSLDPYTVEGVIVAVDKWGLASPHSNRVSDTTYSLPSSPPAAPGGFSLVIECERCVIRMSAGQ